MKKYSGEKPYSAEYAEDTVGRRYFSDLALRYLSLIKLHRESGHLPSAKNLSPEQMAENIKASGQPEWSNVVRHCLAEAGAADALAQTLGLSSEDRENLIQAAILHDFNKRVEIEAQKAAKDNQTAVVENMKVISREVLFSKGIKSEIVEIVNAVGDLDIMRKGNATLPQKILFYIDNITQGSDLVSIKSKHDYLLKRYPKIAAEGAYDKWVSSTEDVQKELAEKIGLANPDELPNFISQKVKQLAAEKAGKNIGETREVWEKFSSEVKLMSELVQEAGQKAIDLRNTFTEKDIIIKPEDGVGQIQAAVTPVDFECQKLIFSRLAKASPKAKFIMEENIGAGKGKTKILNHKNYDKILEGDGYVVDPLDGTNQYKNDRDQWCVAIGKTKNGEFAAGSIFAPKFGLLIIGEKGVGVMIKDGRPREHFADVVVGQDVYELPNFDDFMANLMRGPKIVKKTGSGELGLALVAAGKADVYVQAVQSVWDIAAGAALVEAKGGQVIYYHYRDNKIVRLAKPDKETFNPKVRSTAIIASLDNRAEEYFTQLQSLWKPR